MAKIKRKIELGSSGFFGQANEDVYLDVNLNNTFNEVRPERYDNDFDIQKQYQKERDASRDFILYGFINSVSDFEYNNKLSAQTENYNYNHSMTAYNTIKNSLNSQIKQIELYKADLNAFYGSNGQVISPQDIISNPNPTITTNFAADKSNDVYNLYELNTFFGVYAGFFVPNHTGQYVLSWNMNMNVVNTTIDSINGTLHFSLLQMNILTSATTVAYTNSYALDLTSFEESLQNSFNAGQTFVISKGYRYFFQIKYTYDAGVNNDLVTAQFMSGSFVNIQPISVLTNSSPVTYTLINPTFINQENALIQEIIPINKSIQDLTVAHNATMSFINTQDVQFLELWASSGVSNSNPVIQSYLPQNQIVLQGGQVLNYVQQIPTTRTTYVNGNAFDIYTRKYYTEFNNGSLSGNDVAYIFVNGTGLTPDNSIFKVEDQLLGQQLVFRDASGVPISYGTNTQEINNDGTLLNVDNDFPFFYGKHWLNNTISIDRSFVAVASFVVDNITVARNETTTIQIQFDRALLSDASINIVATDITTQAGDYFVPSILNFVVGETSASFDIQISGNSTIELTEVFTIQMQNPQNISIGAIDLITITILPTEIDNSVTYNFQNIYKNLQTFNVYPLSGGTRSANNYNNYSYLRDGFFKSVGQDPNSFYPNDQFMLTITNAGVDTIFLSDNGLNTDEFVFSAGTSYSINVSQNYAGSITPPWTAQSFALSINVTSSEFLALDINGIIYDNLKTNSDLFNQITGSSVDVLTSTTYTCSYVLSGDPTNAFIPSPIDYLEFDSDTGLPIVIRNLNTDITSPQFQVFNATTNPSDFDDFVSYPQNPVFIKLYSNTSDRLNCNYAFSIQKENYKTISVPSQLLSASTGSSAYYMTSSFRNAKVPYSSGDCIADFTVDSAYTINKVSVNGTLMLYDSVFNQTNLSTAQFVQSPIIPITCTMGNGISGFTF